MTQYTFFDNNYKITCHNTVNGWRYQIQDGSECIALSECFTERIECEKNAKITVKNI